MVGIICGGGVGYAALHAAAARAPNFDAVEMSFSGFFVKQYWLVRDGKHDALEQHRHDSDHVTALALGSVKVTCDGQETKVYHAPALIAVPAGTKHAFCAISPQALLYCLHALGEGRDRPSHEVI